MTDVSKPTRHLRIVPSTPAQAPVAVSVQPALVQAHGPLQGPRPTAVSEKTAFASDDKCTKALSRLKAALQDGADVDHALGDAIGMLAGNPRQDIREALLAVKLDLNTHTDFVGVVLQHVHTDHLDPHKADLKEAARLIGVALAPSDPQLAHYRQAIADIGSHVIGELQGYVDGLATFVAHPHCASLLADTAAKSDADAVEDLLLLGAADHTDALQWLDRLREKATFAEAVEIITDAAHDRLTRAQKALATAKEDDQTPPPSLARARERVAELLMSHPMLGADVLADLGLSEITALPPLGDPPAGLSTETRAFWAAAQHVDTKRTLLALGESGAQLGAMLAAGAVPGLGIAVALAAAAKDMHAALDAAHEARIYAASGLTSRAVAERLDDDVTRTLQLCAVSVGLSLVGIGLRSAALAKLAASGDTMKGVLAGALASVAKQPHLQAAVAGGLMGLCGAETRGAWERGEYDVVAQDVLRSAGQTVVFAKLMGLAGSRIVGFYKKGVSFIAVTPQPKTIVVAPVHIDKGLVTTPDGTIGHIAPQPGRFVAETPIKPRVQGALQVAMTGVRPAQKITRFVAAPRLPLPPPPQTKRR